MDSLQPRSASNLCSRGFNQRLLETYNWAQKELAAASDILGDSQDNKLRLGAFWCLNRTNFDRKNSTQRSNDFEAKEVLKSKAKRRVSLSQQLLVMCGLWNFSQFRRKTASCDAGFNFDLGSCQPQSLLCSALLCSASVFKKPKTNKKIKTKQKINLRAEFTHIPSLSNTK
jgi:hypothetical protein